MINNKWAENYFRGKFLFARKRFLNIYTITSFLLLVFMPIITWALSSQILRALFFYVYMPEFPSQQKWVSFILSSGFSSFMIDSFSILQFLMPILSVLIVSDFFRMKRGSFHHVLFRTKNYKSYVWKNIANYISTGVIIQYLSFLIVVLFGILTHPIVFNENWSRSLFGEFLGNSFSYQHPVNYFLLEGFLKYVIFSSVYALLGISISFITKKAYLYILIPIGYYFVISVVSASLAQTGGTWIYLFSPSFTLMAGSMVENIPIWMALAPLAIPIIFSICIIEYALRGSERALS